MHFVVLIYPKIDSVDYDFIQNIRLEHDKQYSMADPHFTVVFPTQEPTESWLINHTTEKFKNIKMFSLLLTKATVQHNQFSNQFEVFLLPDEIDRNIARLHDLLYEGELASELRTDIPYVPHITVASNDSRDEMEKLATSISQKSLSIECIIDEVTICTFDGKEVKSIENIHLL